jgi:TetR/AcrR family transcriptional regulator
VTRPALADSNAPAPGRTRRNRGSEVIRAALINAAITEFASHGFEGASTRRIAEAADAHQSQIKYHFDTKDDLSISARFDRSSADTRAVFEATIRGLVHFAARRPELNRIMIQEATSASERLTWLVESRLRDRHRSLSSAWQQLVDDGAVAPIDIDVVYHTVIGAASLLYANAPEAQLLGIEPSDPELIERHADTLVTLFLRPQQNGLTDD